MSFENKTVIVTGGGQGIGRAISRAFAAEKANVVIAEIDEEAGEENCRFIKDNGGQACFIQTDVSDENSVKNMITFTENTYGKIDILINNAGIGGMGNLSEDTMDAWDKVLAINLRGAYMCAKYASKVMSANGGGNIINIASTRAFMSEPGTEAYSASKGGIIALTHSLAISLADKKIRVNSISPGWIDTSAWKKSSVARQIELSEKDHKQHPAGRVGVPEDIAHACLFLCSEKSGFITGTNLIVDGGMTVKMIYEE